MNRKLPSILLFLSLGIFGLFALEWLSRKQIDVSRLNHEFPVWVKVESTKKFTGKSTKSKEANSNIEYRIEWRSSRPSHWVSYGEISKYLIGAVIVSEDWNFFSHSGYDPDEIRSAIRVSLAEKRMVRGASTISQQVVKNVFLSNERSLIRKIRELSLAIEMSEKVPKKKVLEVYFNIAEMGPGIFGIQQAARTYFGKSPISLTPREAAFIAMLLPSPKKYSQSFRKKELSSYAKKTVQKILRKMYQARYISRSSFISAWTTPMAFEAGFVASTLPKGYDLIENDQESQSSSAGLPGGGTAGDSETEGSVETPLLTKPVLDEPETTEFQEEPEVDENMDSAEERNDGGKGE